MFCIRPAERRFEMTEPVHFTASLREDATILIRTQKIPPCPAPTWYSASGDVTRSRLSRTAANPEDYDLLKEKRHQLRGKIVLGALFESL